MDKKALIITGSVVLGAAAVFTFWYVYNKPDKEQGGCQEGFHKDGTGSCVPNDVAPPNTGSSPTPYTNPTPPAATVPPVVKPAPTPSTPPVQIKTSGFSIGERLFANPATTGVNAYTNTSPSAASFYKYFTSYMPVGTYLSKTGDMFKIATPTDLGGGVEAVYVRSGQVIAVK